MVIQMSSLRCCLSVVCVALCRSWICLSCLLRVASWMYFSLDWLPPFRLCI